MRERKFQRALRNAAKLDLNDLRKNAQRNKRLMRNALQCRFRGAYLQRKTLCKALGRAIAQKMRGI